jgi:membrane-anchored protein YejM (alkaline phosphatase superfamily)
MQIPGLPYLKFLGPNDGLRGVVLRQQERRTRQQEYRSIHEHALRLVADPAINITYLHYPVPHFLYIFDRKMNDFSDADGTNYFDNLLLVDRAIGDIRRALTAAGLWEHTTLIVTADHPMRVGIYRGRHWNDEMEERIKLAPERHIPYVIKLAGQSQPVHYAQPFNSTATKELVLAIATRQISTPEQLVAWFDTNRGRFVVRK